MNIDVKRFWPFFLTLSFAVCSANIWATELKPGKYQRIVSVGGPVTETIYALNQGHLIVATDTTSYFPAAAEKTPKVGYQRTLSVEGVISRRPDVVIATAEAGPPKALAQIKSAGIPILQLPDPENVDDVINNIRLVGGWLDVETETQSLIAEMEGKRKDLEELLRHKEDAKKIVFIMRHGNGGPMVAGRKTSAANIIRLSGADNAVDEYEGYKPLTPEALISAAPDFILTTTRGLEQIGGMENFLRLPGISLTPAGIKKRVLAMDALLLLGFGPRTIDAAVELNGLIQ